MPTIADQVATMEHDHAAALVLIDQLNAANAALTSANTSLRNQSVALALEVNDMKHYVDDVRAMAEQLAGSAYEMLRASRRQVGTPAEVIPFAPSDKLRFDEPPYGRPADLLANIRREAQAASLDAMVEKLPDDWPTVGISRASNPTWRNTQGAADAAELFAATQGDSGGEQPTRTAGCGHVDCEFPKCDCDADDTCRRTAATPLPPHAGPMLVKHEGDLPIFLKRDTAYSPERAIFG